MEFLTQVTQQLSQADGRENMQAVLEQLSKNGLDALARSENIDFPRAVSRMKKVEMISILLDEFVRRLDVASEQKNLANNSGTTELQPEDTTAEKHVCDYNTQCVQSAIQDVQNNVDVQPDTEALPDDFIPVQEVSSLPAVPVVEEYLPANTPKVMHWAFKWRYMHWDDFSQYSDEHLIAAGLFLGLKFSPSISRDEAIKILDERMRLILQQTPDEETAACYCQDVQKPITPVAPQHKTSLSTLLVQANHEVDAPLFTTEEMKALTRQAFMETRKIAEKFTAKTSWRGHMVSVKNILLTSRVSTKSSFRAGGFPPSLWRLIMRFVTSCTRKDLTIVCRSLDLLQAKAQYDMELSEFAGTSQEVAMFSAIVEAVKPLKRKVLDAIRYLDKENNY